MFSKFLAELSNDYEKLFEAEIGYDVIIMHIQIFYALGLNIFVLHFLTNGPKKKKENLF